MKDANDLLEDMARLPLDRENKVDYECKRDGATLPPPPSHQLTERAQMRRDKAMALEERRKREETQ